MTSYKELIDKYREYAIMGSASRILYWDLETHMPPKGITLRSDQMALLERLGHRMMTSGALAQNLMEVEREADSLDEVQKRNLYLIRREHDIAMSVPENLVADIEKQRAISWTTWVKAKAAHDWKMFEPELRKLVDLSIKYAEATMHPRGLSNPFDAMIDNLEMGMTQEKAGVLLKDLRNSIAPLIKKYSEESKKADLSVIKRHVPIDVQRKLVSDAVNLIGYDTASDNAGGCIDETEHPFTIGYYDDVRITVHYYENDPFEAFYSGLHEAGHAMYDLNLNHDWMYQPVGRWASMGVHEAMSRFAENMLGRSRSFWRYYLPRLQKITDGVYTGVQLDDILRAVNKVEPSKTRVSADELTYQMHVILRFEIEQKLFGGKIDVSELPHIWNELYDKYLQIKFDHDGEGVLQDVHWSVASYGYFQSYSLGNIYAGMFLRKMERGLSSWTNEVEKGNPRVAIDWLKENVQRSGLLYDPEELVKKVTGSAITVEPFVSYLQKKHSSLWN